MEWNKKKAKREKKGKKDKKVIRIKLLFAVFLVFLIASLAIFFCAMADEIARATYNMQESVDAVADSYLLDSESESVLEGSFMKTFQSKVTVINHIISDFDIQKYSKDDQVEAAGMVGKLLDRATGKYLFICDGDGNVYLANSTEYLDRNLTEFSNFSLEQYRMYTAEADKQANMPDEIEPTPFLVSTDSGSIYVFCKRILDSSDDPVPYYLIMAYDAKIVNEEINSWLLRNKTVLAEALAEKDSMVDLMILEDGKAIFATDGLKLDIYDTFEFRRKDSLNTGTSRYDGVWGTLKETSSKDSSRSQNYISAYQVEVRRANGQSYKIIAAMNLVNMLVKYRFGAAFSLVLILFVLMVVLVIYCSFSAKNIRNRKQFIILSSGAALVAFFVFVLASFYFQSLEDLTEATVSADNVYQQVQGLRATEEEQYAELVKYYKQADIVKTGLISYDVEFSGKKLNEGENIRLHYETDPKGNPVPRKDVFGNELLCNAGADILANKTGLLSGADIWLVCENGFSIASSNEENWSLNINEETYGDEARQVMYGERPYVTEYTEAGEGKTTGSMIIYPISIYAYSDGRGHTVYLSSSEYEDMLEKYHFGYTGVYEPKEMMGVLLIMGSEEPAALGMSRTSFQNNLTTIVTASDCSYAEIEYDPAEGGTQKVGTKYVPRESTLDLEELSVPEGFRDSSVFNYFQEISRRQCYVRVNKEMSDRQLAAVIMENSVVHSQRSIMVTAYAVVAFIALLITYLLFFYTAAKAAKVRKAAEEKKNLSLKEIAKTDPGKAAETVIVMSETGREDIMEALKKIYKKQGDPKAGTQVTMKLLVYIILLLAALFIVQDLFMAGTNGKLGLFVNIYSTDWERCPNAYNLGAALALIIVNLIIFNFAKIVVEIFCVPLGRKVETYAKLTVSVIQYALLFVGAFYGAYLLGMELKSLGTFATVVAGVIGIGSQQLIADVGSGIAMLGEGRYMIGDCVMADGFTGVIREMGIRNCILVNEEGLEKAVSNGRMSSAVLLKKNVPIPVSISRIKKEETETPQNPDAVTETREKKGAETGTPKKTDPETGSVQEKKEK